MEKMIKNSRFAHKEILADINDDANTRWLNKPVLSTKDIYNGDTLEGVIGPKDGSMTLSNKFANFGNSSLLITANTQVENVFPRPACGVTFQLPHVDYSEYNRLSAWVYIESVGHQNFYFHFSFGNNGAEENHAPSLVPNEWNHVVWEVSHIKRNDVTKLSVTPFLMGCPPEGLPELKVYIHNIRAELVKQDHDKGWQLDDRIAYCHTGYFNNAKKVALVASTPNKSFQVYNYKEELVYEGLVKGCNSSLGSFYELDFSSLTTTGEYYLKIDERKTPMFAINDMPYLSSIWKSMNFLRMLRCGEEVVNVHSACHLNCRTVHPNGSSVPNHGGWHDAGDVSQFEICTAEMAQAILELAEKYQYTDTDLYERLLEEAKVGINWLLQTRFGDGSRACAVSYSIWRSNVLKPDNKSVLISQAENGPFENLCSAAALSVAAQMYKESDAVFAKWCARSAVEDYQFGVDGYKKGIYTKRWGTNVDAQVVGCACMTACELYLLTCDNKYINEACNFANIILACQQSEYPSWDIPVRGYFYEDPAHTSILTYEHRGHEQTPIQGLARLLEIMPNHNDAEKWRHGLELYAEYVIWSIDKARPYNLLPAHIYEVDKLNAERFTIPATHGTIEEGMANLKQQAMHGIKLNEGVYLRLFPIAVQRRGYHATLLSKVKAVTMIAKVLDKTELGQIAIDQLEWIFGKNPFASSTMYGEGHNFHPLYVAFSRQMVGALPVGIKTLGDDDEPFWPTINNAVFKEIWGHTTGKYLWVLADLVEIVNKKSQKM